MGFVLGNFDWRVLLLRFNIKCRDINSENLTHNTSINQSQYLMNTKAHSSALSPIFIDMERISF